jgi:hypothetical protein
VNITCEMDALPESLRFHWAHTNTVGESVDLVRKHICIYLKGIEFISMSIIVSLYRNQRFIPAKDQKVFFYTTFDLKTTLERCYVLQ